MSVIITPLNLSGFDGMPGHARECVFWVVDPEPDAPRVFDPGFEVEAWLSMVTLEWGTCGAIAWQGGTAVGHAVYAPPAMVPRANGFPTSPVSTDAILLSQLSVAPDWERGGAVFDALLASVLGELVRRGVRAVEAFGYREPADVGHRIAPMSLLRSAVTAPGPECSVMRCMIPAAALARSGFDEIAPHHRFPRYRMELGHDIGWKQQVEAALDDLLGDADAGNPANPAATGPARLMPVTVYRGS